MLAKEGRWDVRHHTYPGFCWPIPCHICAPQSCSAWLWSTSQCHEHASLLYARRLDQRLALCHAGSSKCLGRNPAASKVANEHHSSLWCSSSCALGRWAPSSSLGPSTFAVPFWKYRNSEFLFLGVNDSTQTVWVSQAAGLHLTWKKREVIFCWCN